MDKVSENDISIGRDKWIPWVELDHGKTPFNIDEFLKPTMPFWTALETDCVASCCGIDAFALWPDSIQSAKQQVSDNGVKQKFEKLKADLSEQTDATFISSSLNNLFNKKVFLDLLDHIISHL